MRKVMQLAVASVLVVAAGAAFAQTLPRPPFVATDPAAQREGPVVDDKRGDPLPRTEDPKAKAEAVVREAPGDAQRHRDVAEPKVEQAIAKGGCKGAFTKLA